MRRWHGLACVLIGGLCMGLFRAQAWAETESPTQLVQRLVQAIGSIKAAENGHLSATEQAENDHAAKIANTILDVPGVSQWALGRHWKERSEAEQHEFVTLLEALFSKIAYPKSAGFFGDLQISYAGERITGQGALVRTMVKHAKEGMVSIDYKLIQNNGTWRVRDILLDDVSLALNLRSQFNKIITEHSYVELLRRMREKLEESS